MIFKKTVFLIGLMLVACTFGSCSPNFNYKVETRNHSVLVDYGSSIVQIEIINESIIHIKKYLQTNEDHKLPDYVTVLDPQSVQWKVVEYKDHVTIETSKVTVSINEEGVIDFFDKKDKKVLGESPDSTNKNSLNYSVSQSFESGDEGLYGLGQYQSGIMNWKNVPVRLRQYNQEIAIPFLVSTNNYGIYWHNYSITDFNYPSNEIKFIKTLDEEKNIREAYFTP